MLRVRRDRKGMLEVHLDRGFAQVLRALPDRLRQILTRADFKDRVSRRLFPPAYQDPEKEAEYRELLGDDLVRRKLEAVEVFERSLRDWRERRKTVIVRIEPEAFELWLGFVNDMRLVLGTELDIRDESWQQEWDPLDPRAQDVALLHCLSWLEEELLQEGTDSFTGGE